MGERNKKQHLQRAGKRGKGKAKWKEGDGLAPLPRPSVRLTPFPLLTQLPFGTASRIPASEQATLFSRRDVGGGAGRREGRGRLSG